MKVKACGVCHTDLHYRDGGINDDFPFLLGHEAAGVVEAVGDGVTNVSPGDTVVIAWRAPCGTCRSCAKGRPWYCFNSANATQKMTLDGVALAPALGIGSVRGEDARRGDAVRADRPEREARGGGTDRMWRDGRPRRGDVHGQRATRRHGRRVRLRGSGRRSHPGCRARRERARSSRSTSTLGSSSGRGRSARRTR